MYIHLQNDTPEIKILLEKSKSTNDPRMKLRYDVIIQLQRGYSYKEISKINNISYNTVRNYERSYNAAGIAGLVMNKSPGTPKKLSEEQEIELYKCIVTQTPSDVGFKPFMNWNANLLRQWVKRQFGVTYSERGMREVLYRLELSYTRPTYSLEKADPEKQEQFKKDFEVVKKN